MRIPNMFLPAVLHPDVVDFLILNKDNNFKENVGHCICKLRQGQFDGGLRVKKLQGIAKKIWEARITKASRLIFTYEKSRQPHTGKLQTYIAVQDICLEHDDVSRCAKARKRTFDANWLYAEEIEVIGSMEGDRNSLSLSLDQHFAFDRAQIEDLQISDDFVDELLGNIQWRVVESEEQWQRAIIQQDGDLPLKLTPEEYELLSLYGNLLLSGSAGTGKTTVGLYRLLKSLETSPPTLKRLYVAHNPILVKEAQKHFKRLCGANIAEMETIFQFKTIRDLCSEILESAGQVYDSFNEVDYQIFEQLYRRPERQQYPPALVWDEIRSLIKGSQLATDVNMLTQREYERLGKKKAFLIPYNQRHIVYKLAEWYQKRLNQDGGFDEIDLARKALQIIKQGKGNCASHAGKGDRYQLIVCDEVQDFTELQLELLVRLIRDDGHLFFAGDLHQMISPSGFQWENLKTKFFSSHRQVVQKTLNFNFRSVGCLVNLANQLLQLRSRLLKESISHSEQSINSYGDSARLIAAPLTTLQPTIGELNSDDAILVRTEADKKRLSAEFKSSFVFTIGEAKGLEFDTVFLVEFFKENQNLWNKVLGGKQPLKETEIPQLRLEMNLLYVAVTRSRRILNIWETQLSEVWSQVELVSFVQLINTKSVKEQRVEPTPQMWRDRGLYYQDAGFYRQAVECFEKAGDIELQRLATAKFLVQQRKYIKAAEIFVDLQKWQDCARLFEIEKQWLKAAEKYDLAGLTEKAANCRAINFKEKGKLQKAAEQYDMAGKPELAKKCREEAEKFRREVQFPKNYSMGKLYISDMKDRKPTWKEFGEAQGYVKVPEEKCVKLEVSWEVSKDLSPLANLNHDNLHTLILRGTEVNDDGLAYLQDLTGLQELDLWDTQVSDAGLVHLANLKSLQELHLYEISNDGIEHLKYLEKLEILHLYCCSNSMLFYSLSDITENNLEQELAYLKSNLYLCEDITKKALFNLKQALPKCKINFICPNASSITYEYEEDLEDAYNYYQRCVVFNLIEEEPNLAIKYLGKALQMKPDFAEAYFAKGNCKLLLGDNEGAIEDYNQAIRIYSKFAEAYNGRGRAWANLGDRKEAILNYNQALTINYNRAEFLTNRGFEFYCLGDQQAALEDHNKALQLDPYYSEAYFKRGLVHYETGNYEAAVKDYVQSLFLKPSQAKVYCNRGKARDALGDYQGAITDYNRALRLTPNLPEVYYYQGVTRLQMANLQGAIEDCQKAAELYQQQGKTDLYEDVVNKITKIQSNSQQSEANIHPYPTLDFPKNSEGFANRADSKAARGDFQGLIKDFAQAIKLDPSSAKLYFRRATYYNQLENLQKAIEEYNQALSLDPNFADAYNDRGIARRKLGDYAGAIQDYNKALQINPHDYDIYNNRGLTRIILKDYLGAIEDFKQLFLVNSNYFKAYFSLGCVYHQLEEYEKSIENYTQALTIDPNSSDAYYSRGLAYHKLKNKQRAIEDLQLAVKLYLDQGNISKFRQVYATFKQLQPKNMVADANVDRGVKCSDFQEAMRNFNLALKLNPNHALAYYNCGVLYREHGFYEKAIENFTISIKLDPGDPDAYDERGLVYMKLREEQAAIQDFNQAIQLSPNHLNAYLNRGCTYSKIRDYRGAIQDFNIAIVINSHDADAYYNRANAYQQLGYFKEAFNDFKKATNLYKQQGRMADYQDAITRISEI